LKIKPVVFCDVSANCIDRFGHPTLQHPVCCPPDARQGSIGFA
jgi:hypothetical protein